MDIKEASKFKINGVLKPIEDLVFVTTDELFNNIRYIKERYVGLEHDYKEIYKWYFFNQLCLLKDQKNNPIKTNLWTYISTNNVEYKDIYLSYKFYKRSVKERLDKIYKNVI